jgi:hypothetical protein
MFSLQIPDFYVLTDFELSINNILVRKKIEENIKFYSGFLLGGRFIDDSCSLFYFVYVTFLK